VDFTENEITYFIPTLITRVEPSLGSVRGGTTLTIVGKTFSVSEKVVCFIDGVTIHDTIVISKEMVQCKTPYSDVLKLVSVQLESPPGVIQAVLSNAFRYVPEITLSTLSPTLVPSSSVVARNIDVYGLHFELSPLLSCRFGNDVIVIARYMSSSHLSCPLPMVLSSSKMIIKVSNE
jgi:hypothetical protein